MTYSPLRISPNTARNCAPFSRRAKLHASKQAWDEQARNLLFIRDPVRAVLGCAGVVVPQSSVHQKHSKINAIKVRNQRIEPCKHAPGETHDPIPGIIYLSSSSPPSRREKLSPSYSWHPLQVRYGVRVWVPPKCILLAIRSPGVTKEHRNQVDIKQFAVGKECLMKNSHHL